MTLICPAPWTTWLLVMTKPSGVKIKPEPLPPRPRADSTCMRTTEGLTDSATCVTTCEYASSASVSLGIFPPGNASDGCAESNDTISPMSHWIVVTQKKIQPSLQGPGVYPPNLAAAQISQPDGAMPRSYAVSTFAGPLAEDGVGCRVNSCDRKLFQSQPDSIKAEGDLAAFAGKSGGNVYDPSISSRVHSCDCPVALIEGPYRPAASGQKSGICAHGNPGDKAVRLRIDFAQDAVFARCQPHISGVKRSEEHTSELQSRS